MRMYDQVRTAVLNGSPRHGPSSMGRTKALGISEGCNRLRLDNMPAKRQHGEAGEKAELIVSQFKPHDRSTAAVASVSLAKHLENQ